MEEKEEKEEMEVMEEKEEMEEMEKIEVIVEIEVKNGKRELIRWKAINQMKFQ